MSCVMTTDTIYNAFYDADVAKGFLHSHSFTGNPLACAAALASLEIFEQEKVIEHNQEKIAFFAKQLAELENSDLPVKDIRQTGMIVAFTLDFADNRGKALAEFCLNYSAEQGVLIRPIGNHVYLIPPYCTTIEELGEVFNVLKSGVRYLVENHFNSKNDFVNLP